MGALESLNKSPVKDLREIQDYSLPNVHDYKSRGSILNNEQYENNRRFLLQKID